ncbi:hypothetical protein MPH_03249 [Macrophomina phaseolina MS6]|uniref:Uncharacterized protein n=1 Tax=Macrophomina phaseolina (strain MS6) TaxID=1126212 RepID=K2RA73_MACPH|nr:hypothetical protein MPH_03249 [Macrophomina phaseolina MS6]
MISTFTLVMRQNTPTSSSPSSSHGRRPFFKLLLPLLLHMPFPHQPLISFICSYCNRTRGISPSATLALLSSFTRSPCFSSLTSVLSSCFTRRSLIGTSSSSTPLPIIFSLFTWSSSSPTLTLLLGLLTSVPASPPSFFRAVHSSSSSSFSPPKFLPSRFAALFLFLPAPLFLHRALEEVEGEHEEDASPRGAGLAPSMAVR